MIVRGLTATLLVLLAACGGQDEPADPGTSADATVLGVATRNAPTTWFLDRDDRAAGPEHDLVEAFAAAQGLRVEWQLHDGVGAVLDAVATGSADLAAAGLTVTERRAERVRFSRPVRSVRELLVCRRGSDTPDEPDELPQLAGRQIVVSARTSYVATLTALAKRVAGLRFETADAATELLLQRVAEGQIDCTVADSHIVALNRRLFPSLQPGLSLGPDRPLAWAVARGNDALIGRVDRWLASRAGRSALSRIEQRYYAWLPEFDYVDLRAFHRRVRSRLPKYWHLFVEAAAANGLDPYLLAAQAYQESHWNPKARSPTGVRGMMMLTRAAARELGVDSRLDPRQSIDGGARYLARMLRRLPETAGEDRLWLALAAYNVGWGHLSDARELAAQLDREPDRWESLREVLPLLSDRRYYRKLRHGSARGVEPVIYVRRIRNYYDILRHHPERPKTRPGAGKPVSDR